MYDFVVGWPWPTVKHTAAYSLPSPMGHGETRRKLQEFRCSIGGEKSCAFKQS